MKIKTKELSPDPQDWKPIVEAWEEYARPYEARGGIVYAPPALFWIKWRDSIYLALWHPRSIGRSDPDCEIDGKIPVLLNLWCNNREDEDSWWPVKENRDNLLAQKVKDHTIVVTGPK
jgi:hypothetical protein